MPATLKITSVVVLLCAAALTGACRTSAPLTPAAQACAAQCATSQSQCRARADSAAQQCEWRRQQAQRDLDNCRANTTDASRCNQQVPDCHAASYGQCDAQSRQCDAACGGAVTDPAKK